MRIDAVLVFPAIPGWEAQYPTGLYQIATHCASDYNVIVVDERLEPATDALPSIAEYLRRHDILALGISVLTGTQIASALRISRVLHGVVPVVWGGMHASLLPESTLSDPAIDYVVAGEGEEAFLQVLRHLDGKTADSEAFWERGRDKVGRYNFVRHLADFTYVDFERFPVDDRYMVDRDGFGRGFAIETSRGCPHGCRYCHNSRNDRPYRARSPESVLACMDNLIQRNSVEGFAFQEDNFFIDLDRATSILDGVSRRDGVKWKANCRIDQLDRILQEQGMMELLVQSGCQVLQSGVESGSDRVLDYIGKGITKQLVLHVNRRMAKYPVSMRYNFIVGFPSESKQEVGQTLDLMEQLPVENRHAEPPFLNIYNPYPGTPLFDDALEAGFIPPDCLEGWARLSWNSADHLWRTGDERRMLEKASRTARARSQYLKGGMKYD